MNTNSTLQAGMDLVPVEKGRLCVRNVGRGEYAIVGCLTFPPTFRPTECAQYLALDTGEGLSVSAHRIDSAPLDQELDGAGVAHLLQAPIWRETALVGAFTFRLYEAFPDDNIWTLFGVSRQAPLRAVSPASAHSWFDMEPGRIRAFEAPWAGQEVGEGIASLLDRLPVWPGPHDEHYTLPAMESSYRHHFARYADLMAQLGAGEIDHEGLIEAVRADPHIFHIRHGSIQEDYCRYLAVLRALGGIEATRPYTQREIAKKNQLVGQALQISLLPEEQRVVELSRLVQSRQKGKPVTTDSPSP